MNKKQSLLLSIGLFIISLSFIIKHFIPLSDGSSGFIIGVGLGLEILALVGFRKKRKSNQADQYQQGI